MRVAFAHPVVLRQALFVLLMTLTTTIISCNKEPEISGQIVVDENAEVGDATLLELKVFGYNDDIITEHKQTYFQVYPITSGFPFPFTIYAENVKELSDYRYFAILVWAVQNQGGGQVFLGGERVGLLTSELPVTDLTVRLYNSPVLVLTRAD
ncbi:MAG TPA: hypothetical protein VI895_12855 [Bdellovibrionota bacterium]|nr:hypothetical protein [Bdellovibrionota bacterium]